MELKYYDEETRILDFSEGHKDLWGNFLAKNPEKEKYHWPGWKNINYYRISYRCFPCEAALRLAPNGHLTQRKCNYCPLDWPNGQKCGSSGSTLFKSWLSAKDDLEKKAYFAEQIANVEWFEDVIKIFKV